VKGDTGPQGLQGEKGDTGPQGPSGPSNAYYMTTEVVFLNTAFGFGEVAGFTNLPGGKYLLSVSMSLTNQTPSLAAVQCVWRRTPPSGGEIENIGHTYSEFMESNTHPDNDFVEITSFSVPYEFASTQHVRLWCQSNTEGQAPVVAQGIVVTALEVETSQQ
jgi:hypothetical protein